MPPTRAWSASGGIDGLDDPRDARRRVDLLEGRRGRPRATAGTAGGRRRPSGPASARPATTPSGSAGAGAGVGGLGRLDGGCGARPRAPGGRRRPRAARRGSAPRASGPRRASRRATSSRNCASVIAVVGPAGVGARARGRQGRVCGRAASRSTGQAPARDAAATTRSARRSPRRRRRDRGAPTAMRRRRGASARDGDDGALDGQAGGATVAARAPAAGPAPAGRRAPGGVAEAGGAVLGPAPRFRTPGPRLGLDLGPEELVQEIGEVERRGRVGPGEQELSELAPQLAARLVARLRRRERTSAGRPGSRAARGGGAPRHALDGRRAGRAAGGCPVSSSKSSTPTE